MQPSLSPQTLAALAAIDTCTLANAIESFEVRLRNEGFADSSIRGFTPCPSPVAGYAVTARIRCSTPPMSGGAYVDRTDWWNHIQSIPGPHIAVIEDVDPKPGTGAFLGEVHCRILQALGCVAVVTNGSVRDVPAIAAAGFKVFANHVSVSHAYAHIVEFGGDVTVGGLKVQPGDVLHADSHGVLSIPPAIAPKLPEAAARLLAEEARVIELCQSKEFSIEKLRDAVRGIFN
jgi:4-hydroxy-4-methyl-2-oxoglutarate aldolase